MKIISWNCNGAFRKKFSKILDFDADIHVIQECEDPARSDGQNSYNYNSICKS